MKTKFSIALLFGFLSLFSINSYSQDYTAVFDDVCIFDGDPVVYNVFDNDIYFGDPTVQFFVEQSGSDECFSIDIDGNVVYTPSPDIDCCGEHNLFYVGCTSDGLACSSAEILITLKCGKPDCTLHNLEDYQAFDPGDGSPPQDASCATVCENSETTFFIPYNPLYTYCCYNVIGGTYTIGSNPAELNVTWGASGSGFVSISYTDQNNISHTISVCVDILPGPTANFTSDGYVCLKSPISFTNLSIDGDSYYWDFGDGNYSTLEHPTNTYLTPGTFQVTLCVTKQNYDAEGNPSCCCTDCITMEVEVDPLEGPKIYWISTLCEGDSSKYWTDAANCASYTWTVLDNNGLPVPFVFPGTTNDTICLQWLTGGIGTISLSVSGCDSLYCNNPTTVTVPIIPATETISGDTIVCENTTHTYCLPKWLSTDYQWTVLNADLSPAPFTGQGGHCISVTWGSAGIGTIHVDWTSSFLNGLPNHPNGSECSGSADLDVEIRPKFTISTTTTTVCVNTTSTVTALPFDTYNWNVSPFVPNTTTANTMDLNWDTPGTYVVTATPSDTSIYCNSIQTLIFQVFDLPPPLTIIGPDSICPGDQFLYEVTSSETNVDFYWTVTNGTPTSGVGNTIQVTWNGPGTISVYQQMIGVPYCQSASISKNVVQKMINGPLLVSGSAACTNSLGTYTLTPTQIPDADINWSINGLTDGSVIGGQGTHTIQVQWNNDPGPVSVDVEVIVCDDTLTYSLPLTLNSPIVPNIIQNGILCPGVNADLEVSPAIFTSYSWAPVASTTFNVTISAAGTYTVNTIDANGCAASASYTANEVPGAIANISSGDNPHLCFDQGGSVTIQAQTNPFYLFEWFCSSTLTGGPTSQGPPSNVSSFLHNNTGVIDTYTYYFTVIDTQTGCTNVSDPFTVWQEECIGCEGEPCALSINWSYTNPPFCDDITFSPNICPIGTFSQWSFGDGTFSGSANTNHLYTVAGCYNVRLNALTPDLTNPGEFCGVWVDTSVCVPVAANFDFTYLNCTDVDFTDFSTVVGLGNSITNWNWSFGHVGQFPPTQTFGPGNHTITLTVTDATGCQSQFSDVITIGAVSINSMTANPNPACVGDNVIFSAVAPGANNYFWTFGDGASYTGPSPQHAYLTSGTKNVVLSVSDAEGCTDVDSISVLIHPEVPPASITPGNQIICSGATALFSAPVGYTYQWYYNGAPAQTTQSITVSAAGSYYVVITDANNCSLELDEVILEVIPPFAVNISGNPVICGTGNCTTLNGPTSSSYVSYTWYDGSGVINFGPTITICDGSINNPYYLEIVDVNGCIEQSPPISISVFALPTISIAISPDPCEGKPITLTATLSPPDPNFVYSWSNGDTGAVITVSQAGNYTVTATNTLNGCSVSATATIHPLPDLCIVPEGCYEVCNPDTVCGPIGLPSYTWLFNGVPITGIPGMDHCIEVTQSGTYNFVGTTSFGCTDTSGALILTVIDCPEGGCDDLFVDYSFLTNELGESDSCCAVMSYTNNYGGPIKGLTISSNDATFNFDLTTLDPNLGVQSNPPNSLSLISNPSGFPIPTGFNPNIIEWCFDSVSNYPQQVIIDWFDFENDIVCSDTLEFYCPIEPDCLYMQNDSIYCEDGLTFYEFTVCNPHNAAFNIGYLDILVSSPGGIILTPPFFDLTSSPIYPGTCQTFNIMLSGPGIGGQVFCYNLLGHEFDPNIVDTTLCCSLDTLYCIDIPPCSPCEFVDIIPDSTGDPDDCCFTVGLSNNYDPNFFDEIGVCVISPSTTITLNNPFGSGWTTSSYTSTTANFTYDPGYLPLGITSLPEICVDTDIAPTQQIEIKWIRNGVVHCVDTLETFCEPDCGYLYEESITCDATGFWVFDALLKNNSTFTVSQALITFTSPSGMGIYDQAYSVGTLLPGQTFSSINIPIGAPASAGDTVCFTVTLHEVDSTGLFLSCCNFNHCIILPDCDFSVPCDCGDEFDLAVSEGISCSQEVFNPLTWDFGLISNQFNEECDMVKWNFGDGTGSVTTYGNQEVTHTFPYSGTFHVCIKVIRTAADGSKCVRSACKNVVVGNNLAPEFIIFPNPTEGLFYAQMDKRIGETIVIKIMDMSQRQVFDAKVENPIQNPVIEIDLRQEAKGLYFIYFEVGEQFWIKKVTIY